MLDKRLRKICELVQADTIVDVGADHGFVSAYLLKNNICAFAYVTDISEQSLNKSKILFKDLRINDKAQFISGDGLTVLPHIPNSCAVIAGMGGNEIIKILGDKNRKDGIADFVLCPQNNVPKLRKYLMDNSYKIITDIIIEQSGHFYNIIKTSAGCDKLNELELAFGRTNLKERGTDFLKYIDFELNNFENILKNLKTKDTKVYKYVTMLRQIKG